MTIAKEFDISDISDLQETCWSGALDIIDEFDNAGKGDELVDYLNEVFYSETITDTQLNDYIWFDLPDSDFYHEAIEDDEDEDDDDDEDEDDEDEDD